MKQIGRKNNMKTIWKYTFDITDWFTIEMPLGAEMLDVQVQNGAPVLWALVDPDEPIHTYEFILRGTGHTINESNIFHIGTFQIYDGLVFHLFGLL